MDIITYTPLSKIDFKSLTLETLDFDTPFKMEYCYRIWKTHPLKGEELRKMFWEYMRLHCEKHWNESEGLAHHLFMWYAPELLKALTKEDFDTVVVLREEDSDDEDDDDEDDDDEDDDEDNSSDKNKNVNSKIWTPFKAYTGNFDSIEVYLMLENFCDNAEGASGPLNRIYEESMCEEFENCFETKVPFRKFRKDQYIFDRQVDQMVKNDDIDKIRVWCYTNEVTGSELGDPEYTIDSCSLYCPIDLFYSLPLKTGLLDVAFYYKAMNIIKYLLMNGYKITTNSVFIAVAIGSPELIRLSLQYMKYAKNENAIKYIRNLCKTSHLLDIAKLYDKTEILSWLEDIRDGIIISI
jgi:hypothetical protein